MAKKTKTKTEVVKAKRAPMKPRNYVVTATFTLKAPNKAAALGWGCNLAEHMVDYSGDEITLDKVSASLKPKEIKKRSLFQGF